MNFWQSELGEVTGSPDDAFAKTFTHIPDGTMALARIDAFINAAFNGVNYLSIDWTLTAGDFKGQRVNQKLKVWGDPRDKDPAKTRHRSLNMFKLLYQLFKLQPKHSNDPSDEDLLPFIGKIAGIKIRETEPDKESGKQYNWVAEVHPAEGFKCETGIRLEVHHIVHPSGDGGLQDNAFARNPKTFETPDGDIPF